MGDAVGVLVDVVVDDRVVDVFVVDFVVGRSSITTALAPKSTNASKGTMNCIPGFFLACALT